jgi:effector-binding domain-containing protein
MESGIAVSYDRLDAILDEPRIVRTAARQAAVIRLTIPRSEIQQVMGPAIGEVMAALGAQGVSPAGPVFTHHLRMDPATFDFEVGVPVASPVSPAGRVKPGELPAARVVRTVYRGPYEGLGPAWGEFEKWIEGEGLKPAPDLWERYVRGPESGPDPAAWRTELNKPLMG